MKTGLSTACLYGRSETENSFKILKELGADCCEVFLHSFYEYRPEFAKKYAPRAEGLTVNSVHTITTNFEPQLFSRSLRARGDGYFWLDKVMTSAQILGAKNYTFHGTIRTIGTSVDDFDYLGERLRELVSFCSRFGVRFCLENVHWSLYNRPGVFKELKQRCGDLWGVLDVKQARRSGYPYEKYIDEMAGSISHVHLSDVDENGKMCLPGKGIYNYSEILKRLKDTGFDGAVIIEVYPDNYADVSELKQSLDFLNETVYKI